MSNVIVSFPNPTGMGMKTQTIKTTPAMPLTSIISEVVTKNKLGDPLCFGLKHKKTILDSSLSMRFANLAPGTKLELVTKISNDKVSQRPVTVAVQLDGGQRVVDSFPSITSLWNILINLESRYSSEISESFLDRVNPDGKWITPVCLILNQEFSEFEQLNSTSLQSLGIGSGNVVIRVSFKASFSDYSDIISKIQESRIGNVLQESQNNTEKPTLAQKCESKPEKVYTKPETNITENSINHAPQETFNSTSSREIQIFTTPDVETPLSKQLDLPDDYFELTSTELKMAVANQQARTRRIIEGAPLKTKAMVEQEAKKRMEKYPITLIRVRFPDATQLQAKFQSSESFIQLIEVIKSSLNDPSRSFILSQAPPYRRLDDKPDKTFYELDLFPTAQIHLQFEGSNKNEPVLASTLLETAKELPLPEVPSVSPEASQAPESSHQTSSGSSNIQQASQEKSSPTKSKIPKWLKLKKP